MSNAGTGGAVGTAGIEFPQRSGGKLQCCSAWQSMDTAPKDGTRVLLAYRIDDPGIVDFEVGMWVPNYGCPGWRAAGTFLAPVAWASIPDMPNAEADGGGEWAPARCGKIGGAVD